MSGDDGRVNVVFDGKVLRGQAKGVKADRQQHVIAVHPALPGDHVHGRIGSGVSHVQTGAGGVGKLHQPIELGPGIPCHSPKALLLIPDLLPFFLDTSKLVFHFASLVYSVIKLLISASGASPQSRSRE